MMNEMALKHWCSCGVIAGLMLAAGAPAQVPKAQAAKLGGDQYTCLGALRAGTERVADFTGKWFKDWPGMDKASGYVPSPYADEEPLFTITADNKAKYADKLTAGLEALLRKYPDGFYMNVYPSHRDFRMPDYVCEATQYNAVHSEIIAGGLAITGHGSGIPFPFPDNGLQAIWNVINAVAPWTEEATYDIADRFGTGATTWGRVHFKQMSPDNNPDPDERTNYTSKVRVYFFQEYLLPPRLSGQVAVGFQPNNFKTGSTQAWVYQPGIRRVRKAPAVGFDYPVPPEGLRTSDSDYVFNGSPELYNWKLLGRKVMFVPYNNFKVNDPSLTYEQLLGPHYLNPKYVRYEAHRVWVIEATLKPDRRHIFERRVIYVDEDTWLALTADNYGHEGGIYRVPVVMYHYSQESGTYHRGVSVYHTLPSGAYEATYLVNERPESQWWKINRPMRKREFSPEAAIRAGQ